MSNEKPSAWQDSIDLTDPRAMRALAHPVRMRLLGELRRHGAQSVGMLAEAVDEAPASVSYHLSTLAKYGFVADAPEFARDRRESWWQATASTTSYHPAQLLNDPVGWAASTVLRQQIYRDYQAALLESLESEPQLGEAWVAASTHSDNVVYLTVAELNELKAELDDMFERWTARSHREAEGAAPVTVIAHAFRRRP